MKFKDRIKSYKFWVGLSASLVILLQALGDAFGFTIQNEIINGITMGFCGVLVVLGIVEQPKIETELEEMLEDKTEIKSTDETEKTKTTDKTEETKTISEGTQKTKP
ncbi:MAG: phage holin [Clostridia bacterium]|nr:phage holin [Clostridia bacterium]